MMEHEPGTPPTDPGAARAPAETAPATAQAKLLSINDFFEVQLRVARVLSAEPVEKTDKLLRLRVDLGGEQRQIVAGVARAYEPAALLGKLIIVVANLEPARIRGVESQGMLLAADLDGRPIVATFDEDVPPGTRVR